MQIVSNMNDNTQNPQFFRASLVAAFVTILVPSIIELYGFLERPSVLSDGTPDNAPHRAALILLFSTPIIFTLLVIGWYSITRIFFFCNILSKSSLIISCAVGSSILGSIFAIEGYKSFGMKDALISFAMFAIPTFLFLSIGSLVWCFVGLKRPKNNQTNVMKL